MSKQNPTWLDRSLYAFESHSFDTPDGRLHYVDEGAGPSVVLVHGTPTWSFMYRGLIARLAQQRRVIAVDHLGFGLSDKPAVAPYAPSDHARRLGSLIDALDLSDATLVVHDFGGPIGLAAALARPDRFERLVLFNSWMWSLEDDPSIARGARIAGSAFGRLLYRHLNFAVRMLMPMAVGDRAVLTKEIRRHYEGPLGSPDERMGAWACGRALLDASDWFDSLWAKRSDLEDKAMLLLWGLKDPAFGPRYLERWRDAFPGAYVHTFPSSGHFVPEEAGAAVPALVERFVHATALRPAAGGGPSSDHDDLQADGAALR